MSRASSPGSARFAARLPRRASVAIGLASSSCPAAGSRPTLAITRAGPIAASPSARNASSASKTSHSSSENVRPSSSSFADALSREKISARRSASTKCRRSASSSRCRGRAGSAPEVPSEEASAEGDRDHCMVVVSLGAPDAGNLAVGVEAGEWWSRRAERLGYRPHLLVLRLAEDPPPSGAIENEGCPGGRLPELFDRGAYRFPARSQQLIQA